MKYKQNELEGQRISLSNKTKAIWMYFRMVDLLKILTFVSLR